MQQFGFEGQGRQTIERDAAPVHVYWGADCSTANSILQIELNGKDAMRLGAMPSVSVIIPTHNRPQLLKEALESVVRQSFGGWEAIVVDDASSPPASIDDCWGEAAAQMRIVRHSTSRGGASAKNTGIECAAAPLIAFLDDDDCYSAEYLAKAVAAFERHTELDALFMGVSWFGDNARWAERSYQESMKKVLREAKGDTLGDDVIVFARPLVTALLKSVPMAFQRPVVRAAAIGRIGMYEPGCLLWDCDWAVRAAIHGRVALIAEGLYRQRVDGQGWSSKPTREHDHLMSGVEIADRLLKSCPTGAGDLHGELLQASADARFNLAYYYARTGQRAKALASWGDSLRRKFVPNRLKFLGRIAFAPTKSTTRVS